MTFIAAFMLAATSPAIPMQTIPEPSPLDDQTSFSLSAKDLDRMCSHTGTAAGPFGKAEITAKVIDEKSWSGPTWKLEGAIGPFNRFERWSPENAHTLRYEGDTTGAFNMESLAARIVEIGTEAGWTLFRHENPMVEELARNRFIKKVQADAGELKLWLLADGGIETTSLYCTFEGPNGRSMVTEWEERAANFAKRSDEHPGTADLSEEK